MDFNDMKTCSVNLVGLLLGLVLFMAPMGCSGDEEDKENGSATETATETEVATTTETETSMDTTETQTTTETETSTETESDPNQDPEPSPQPDDEEPVDCSTPLSLAPEYPKVNIWKNVDFLASGGSGDYRFRVEEPANDSQIHQQTGRLMAGGMEGTLTVTVFDDPCSTELTATVDVIGAFSALPKEGRIAFGTAFTITGENMIGALSCSEIINGSGFSLNGCDYTAGSVVATDVIRIEDDVTGTGISIDLQVESTVDFAVNGELWMIPLGSTMWADAEGGTNELSLTLVSGNAVQIDDTTVTAIAEGTSEILVEDIFTGDQQLVKAIVAPSVTLNAERDGVERPRVAMLGEFDWNGDGYKDLMVSNVNSDYAASNSGSVLLYAGGANGIETTPSWSWPNDADSDYKVGDSLAGGDINGDGLPDLAVGARNGQVGNNFTGFVDIFIMECFDLGTGNEDCGNGIDDDGDGDLDCADADCGNPTLPSEPTQQLSSQGESAYGAAVAICDLDGDGYDDVVVGAPTTRTITANQNEVTGAMVVMNGGITGVNELGRITRNAKVWNSYLNDWGYGHPTPGTNHPHTGYDLTQFGDPLVCADVNGDGYADVVTSTPDDGYDGTVTLYLGDASAVLSEDPSLQINNASMNITNSAYMGSWLGFGYLETNGPLMLGIGVPGVDGPETGNNNWRNGAILFYDVSTLTSLGNTADESSATLRLNGRDSAYYNDTNGYLGYENSISWGAYNGEPSLLIGYKNDSYGSPRNGELFWVKGTDITDQVELGTVGTWLNSGTGSELYGWSTAIVDDHFVTFAPGRDTKGENVGAPLVLDMAGTETELDYPGVPASNGFSSSSLFFDIDGNGQDDLLLGAPSAPLSGTAANVGRIFYCADGDTSDCGNELSFSSPAQVENAFIGSKMARGDFDGDGEDELFLLASGLDRPDDYSAFGSNETCAGSSKDGQEGAVLIFKTEDMSQPAAIVYGDAQYVYPSQMIAGFDFDGDGMEDLAFGGPSQAFKPSYTFGKVFMTYGRPLVAASQEILCPDDQLQGRSSSGTDYFIGLSMSAVGDIDGNGCDDIAFGSTFTFGSPVWNNGAMYLLWGGGSACGSQPEISMVLGLSDSEFGYTLFGGKDIDGDGIEDIVSGAPNSYQSFSAQGKVWGLTGAELILMDRIPLNWNGVVPNTSVLTPHSPNDFGSDWLWIGDAVNAKIGQSVGLVPDWNDPNQFHFVINEPYGSGNSNGAGGALMAGLDSAGVMKSSKTAVIAGESTGDSQFGNFLGYGTIAGQTVLVLGAPYSDAMNPDEGAVYVFPLEAP